MSENGEANKANITNKTVTDLLTNFRDGLVALVPIFEEIRIPTEAYEQYEEIDSITEDLFELLVTRHIENVVKIKYNTEFLIAKYNFLHKDYTGVSFIQVMPGAPDASGLLAFISLSTKDEPYDTVYCNKIGYDGKIIQRGVEVNFEGTQFRFVFRTPTGELAAFREIPLKG